MNLQEAKTRAIKLMLEYSVDGTLTPTDENQDYLLLMNGLANDAQMELSNKIPIEDSYTITQDGVNETGYNKYDIPSNFKELKLVTLNDEDFFEYKLRKKQVWVDKCLSGTFEIFYEKTPATIDDTTVDDYEFEVEERTHFMIPYYMAGMALGTEKSEISSQLLNMFYSRISSLTVIPANQVTTITNTSNW